MKSPFPGMDPYLEQWWRDVHHSLCTYARDELQGQLGGDLRARIDERLVVEQDERGRDIYPDLRLVERPHPRGAGATPNAGIAVAEPLIVQMRSEPSRQGFIEILDVRHGGRVVTVIEFLSPSNKRRGSAREQYLVKQGECLDAGVSLVEIDLVRGGDAITVTSLFSPPSARSDYEVCVVRGWKTGQCEVYPIWLRDRVPGVRVPLRQEDPDAHLDLQALIDQVYRNGGYADDIDYARPCEPPLDPLNAKWANELLKSSGR